MKKIALFSLFLALFLSACSSSMNSRMQSLSIGMSEEQVKDTMGSDYQVVASSMNKDGKAITGWRYQSSDKDPAYMVYFVDGKLAQFGEAGALRAIPELGDPSAASK